jgi:hypothetical protein
MILAKQRISEVEVAAPCSPGPEQKAIIIIIK